MKRNLKQVLCVLLAVGMLVCLAACGGSSANTDTSSDGKDTSATGSTSPDAEYKNEEGKYAPKKGVLEEYKDRTFSVLVIGDPGTYQSDDFTLEAGEGGIDYGNTFYEQVKLRNDEVAETYGVTLEVHKEKDTFTKASQDVLSNTQLYDAVVLTVGSMSSLAQQGYLTDLLTLSNFDANAPWWDESANKAYTVRNKLYFSTGDITIMNKANVWSILFNKDIIRDSNLESPYDLVKNGTWTFDKMCEMAQTVNTANATSDWSDTSIRYGMITAYGDIIQFFGASGMTLCSKTPDDEPTLEFGNSSASIELTQKILDTINNASWKIYAEECTGGGNVWDESFKVFYSGRALFRPSGFTATTKLRSLAEFEFGIVPMPKMTETQNEYYTIASGSFAAGILKNCKDPEFSAYMLDAYAAGAKNYITPAYIEKNLIAKSYLDKESEEYVSYIFDHIVYDVGYVYNFGQILNMFGNLAKDGSSDITSKLDSIRSTIEADIDTVVMAYEDDI